MEKRIWKNIVEVKPDGKKGIGGGAYTLAFVYSNKGNFLVKGYYREVKKYLNDKYIAKGHKFFVNYSLQYNGVNRDIWTTSNENVTIFEPDRKSKTFRKWRFYKSNGIFGTGKTVFKFKRLPKRWLPIFDDVI